MLPTPGVAAEESRRSPALESLTTSLRASVGLYVLDFGAANQANIDYFTGLGHRLYSEDLLYTAASFFRPDEGVADPISGERIEEFLHLSLNFPFASCNAVLLWDTLQFLPPGIEQPFIDRIYRIMAPDAALLAIFHPESAGRVAQPHACRVLDERTLQLNVKDPARPLKPLNNRNIQHLFQRFTTIKFFLTREHLREVLVRR